MNQFSSSSYSGQRSGQTPSARPVLTDIPQPDIPRPDIPQRGHRTHTGSGLQHRVGRFLLAGLANTAFGYVLYALLVALGLHPQFALIGQFALGILWNRALHGRFVYGPAHHARLLPYASAYLLVYLFNAMALYTLIHLGTGPYLAQALALGPTVVLSYLLVSRAFGVSPTGSPGTERGRHERD